MLGSGFTFASLACRRFVSYATSMVLLAARERCVRDACCGGSQATNDGAQSAHEILKGVLSTGDQDKRAAGSHDSSRSADNSELHLSLTAGTEGSIQIKTRSWMEAVAAKLRTRAPSS